MPAYLDNAATTRVCPEAARAALEVMTEGFGNPSSGHAAGRAAAARLAEDRAVVAQRLGCAAEELYFTPQSRGKGYGHQYFQWLFAEYPQAKRFRLEVCPYNPKAKKLYEQLGFEMLNYGQMILDR